MNPYSDDFRDLKRLWQAVCQGRLDKTTFDDRYRRSFYEVQVEFDRWKMEEENARRYGGYLVPSNPLAPQVTFEPQIAYNFPERPARAAAPPFAPRIVHEPRPPPEPVAQCARCTTWLHFPKPTSDKTKLVRCPQCNAEAEFQACWTCPKIILRDSTCPDCYKKYAAPGVVEAEAAVVESASTSKSSSPRGASPRGKSPGRRDHEEKGLANSAGQNNCFLNVTIQSLWHLQPFRDRFESETVNHKPNCSCVHCALGIILANYRYAESETLSPNVLRHSLDLLFAAENKFQLGDLSDATECFDAICACLHDVAVGGKSVETLCNPLCSAHWSFQLLVEERIQCKKCGLASLDVQSMFVHYVYASQIVDLAQKVMRASKKPSFETILRKLNVVEPKACAKCNTVSPISRAILKPWPKIFAVAIAWADANPPLDTVTALLSTIESEVNLCNIFDPPNVKEKGRTWRLRGMICYYLKHYAAYFLSEKKGVWFSFDDVSVQEVGPEWKDVIRKCRMGHSKPTMVFFEEVPLAGEQVHEDNTPSPISKRPIHRSIRERMKFFGK